MKTNTKIKTPPFFLFLRCLYRFTRCFLGIHTFVYFKETQSAFKILPRYRICRFCVLEQTNYPDAGKIHWYRTENLNGKN